MSSKKKKRKTVETVEKKKSFSKKRLFLLLLTGFLSFLIYPTVFGGVSLPNLGFLAWGFLVPLILAMEGEGPLSVRKIFFLTFLSAVLGHFGLLYWLVTAMKSFGGMNLFEALGTLTAQVLFFSVIFSLFFTLAVWVKQKSGLPYFLSLPVFMTLRDFVLHYFPFGGFPWGIPPYSQGEWLFLFQWVDYTGPLGLSFFIYLINGLLAGGILAWLKIKKLNRTFIIPIFSIIVLFIFSMLASTLSLNHFEKNKTSTGFVKIALIQANVPQDIKWNRKLAQRILNRHIELTAKAASNGAELILWPETAYPNLILEKKIASTKFLNLESLKTPLLIGSNILHKEGKERKLFNGVVHIDTSASIRSIYKKMHLVPFGEYLPFKKYLRFMESLTQAVGYLSPGKEYVLFDLLNVKWAPLICIEDIFPRYARGFARRGADVLINFTNDAWYGDSSMQHQHVVYSQFRALENRLSLIRATNTGLTAVIDATGKVVQDYRPFTEGYLFHNLKIEKGVSFYSRHGEKWIVVVFLLALAFSIYAFRRKK